MVPDIINNISRSSIIPFIIILTLLSIGILIPILSILIFGVILAYYVRYICRYIQPYVKYKSLAVFLGMIILAIPIILLLYFTFSQFISIAGSLFGSLQQAASANNLDTTQLNQAIKNLGLAPNITQTMVDTIKSWITQSISTVASYTISIISSIPGLAAQLLILIFSTFYFARDGEKVIQYVKDVVPEKDKHFYQQVFDSADDVLKSIIVGNVIPAVILGILSGVIYYFLGYPYVILLAILSGIAMFIPVIGPWIVYGAIGLFSMLMGNTLQGVLVIIFGWIIETSTDFYIRPRISVQYSEIHPLIFLLGFIYGAVTMGLPGLFIGPLILGITYAAYKVYQKEKLKEKEENKPVYNE
ncbi:MAG: putative inner membrane protein [Methanobacterium sp. PtaU1.Bin242]|jgi:predicted PurR-regulated permease PerM|nr:MAG: putative inner membrane protein [Methanobacterium sp. PtaU1.Bin242]